LLDGNEEYFMDLYLSGNDTLQFRFASSFEIFK